MLHSISPQQQHILDIYEAKLPGITDTGKRFTTQQERSENMSRFTSGLLGGIAVGLAVGMGYTMTDKKHRRRVMRDSKRAIRKAGHFIDDIKSSF